MKTNGGDILPYDMATIGIDASRAEVVNRTGNERYAWTMIQELKQLIPSEHRVRLYSRDPLRGDLARLPLNWESVVLRWPPKWGWTHVRLSWEMLFRSPDVLFLMSHVLPLIIPRRLVKTTHDVSFVAFPEAFNLFDNLYYRIDMWFTVRCAHILTSSEFSKSEIIRFFKANPERIIVTPLGYDADRFHPMPLEAAKSVRDRHGVNGRYFLYVGRLERKKNTSVLIEAFRRYKDAHPGDTHELVLAGRPGEGYADEMRAHVGKPIMRSVRELGFVPDEELPALYQGATAFVFTTGYEGFGLPVLEAFACGAPVIASSTTSVPEVAGNAAILADPRDADAIAAAMARLADVPALRTELIAAGTERLKLFSWSACARLTWAEIEKATKR